MTKLLQLLVLFFLSAVLAAGSFCSAETLPEQAVLQPQTSNGWIKYENNPVLGGEKLGTCFDITMLLENGVYKMWFSWRPKKSIAYTESKDGIHWSEPKIVLEPVKNDWEHDLNRPAVYKKDGRYHLWYTGQAKGGSKIGYAVSQDGLTWERQSEQPVLTAEKEWEKVAVMCPHVEWDTDANQWRMWYSGGEQYEPNAIGYATSKDGLVWKKYENNPIFSADKKTKWENHKVTACQVLKHGEWWLMFYIGFEHDNLARIGIARSKDGITNWERLPSNPIISPDKGQWDEIACYKPFVIYDADAKKWLLWYNGRNRQFERIGLAVHEGEDLGFPNVDIQNVDVQNVDVQNKQQTKAVLQPEQFKHYIDFFNSEDNEIVKQFYPNAQAWEFLSRNIPLFDYPDKEMEQIYYFRWWTFRKHIKQTPDGFVITEFLPDVSWAKKYNTISCASGHHFREGRWLHEQQYLNDYAVFWLRKGGSVRDYASWIADSVLRQSAVTGSDSLAKELLPDFIANFEAWVKERRDTNGLFWHRGDRDGMELSAASAILKTDEHYRATINSYLFAEAAAIAEIAERAGKPETAERFRSEASTIQKLLHSKLWDENAKFYKVAPRVKNPEETLQIVDVREEHGYTPWYFEKLTPPDAYSVAWEQLLDTKGFYAPFGPTTTEQRHPRFQIAYKGHECLWDGPSWPYATSITLTGLANLIVREKSAIIDINGKRISRSIDIDFLKKAYLETLSIYAKSHHRQREEDQKVVCWIDENLNPFNGDWISRTRLKTWRNGTWDAKKGGVERGKDYNHSTFCDLIINGLVGFRPSLDNTFTVYPLVPADIEYFCLDNVLYHGKIVTVYYDRTGTRYHKGSGFHILINGQEVSAQKQLPDVPVTVSF